METEDNEEDEATFEKLGETRGAMDLKRDRWKLTVWYL